MSTLTANIVNACDIVTFAIIINVRVECLFYFDQAVNVLYNDRIFQHWGEKCINDSLLKVNQSDIVQMQKQSSVMKAAMGFCDSFQSFPRMLLTNGDARFVLSHTKHVWQQLSCLKSIEPMS